MWCSSTSLAFSPHSILSRDHIMPARSSEPKDHDFTTSPDGRSSRPSGHRREVLHANPEGLSNSKAVVVRIRIATETRSGLVSGGGGREPVDATGHLFELAAVPKVVQRPRVKAQTNGVAGAEHSLVFGEHMP